MTLRPLIITDDEKAAIKRVMAHASSHQISTAQLQRIIAGTEAPPGKNKYHICVIPVGYYCVYTEEEQPHLGICRHLSVAVMGDGCAPNELSVMMLAIEFGFRGDLSGLNGFKMMDAVWTDDLAGDKVAVNLLQRVAAPTG